MLNAQRSIVGFQQFATEYLPSRSSKKKYLDQTIRLGRRHGVTVFLCAL